MPQTTETPNIDVSVDLQDPFSYMLTPIIIIGIVILLAAAALILFEIYRRKKNAPIKVKEPKPVVFKPKDKTQIKAEYLEKVEKIRAAYTSGAMDVRTAHQELSAIIRMFVHEMTGINTQNFSLTELKAHKITSISGLIEEFYAPEFAQRSEKDTINSINDARKVIESWN